MNFSFVPLFLVTLIFFGRYQQQQLDYNFGGRLIADAANRFVAIHSLRGKTRLASGYHYTDHRRIESAGFRQNTDSAAVRVSQFQNDCRRPYRHLRRLACRTRRSIDERTACFGNRIINRHSHRRCFCRRHSGRPSDCRRLIVFCCRKGLKSPPLTPRHSSTDRIVCLLSVKYRFDSCWRGTVSIKAFHTLKGFRIINNKGRLKLFRRPSHFAKPLTRTAIRTRTDQPRNIFPMRTTAETRQTKRRSNGYCACMPYRSQR